MKKTSILTGLCALLAFTASAEQPAVFQPGYLAVFQEGSGGPGRCLPLGASTGITNYNADDLAGSRQNQIFIDQFDPNGVNQTNPSVLVAVPTNGYSAMLVNGNAGTEGYMTLSDDRSVLTFAGYAGDILSLTTGGQTAPSNLGYDRAVATVNAFTNLTTVYRGSKWYGTSTGKTNPRGAATDGAGNFWGCGNGYGSLYYSAIAQDDPIQFQNIALTSAVRVQNHKLFTSVKGSESVNLYPAGIYTLVDFYNNPADLPTAASFLRLYLQAQAPYTNCIGFDVNPSETIAYVCDATVTGTGGIQKYVRSGLGWKLAYNLRIPGYYGLNDGIMTNAASTNTLVGCYSVTVDWSGANPILYATTSDSGVNSGASYYGNRVIRINDTNTIQNGSSIIALTNILTTVVRPPVVNGLQLTNIVYKSVAFTPDLRPVITNQPVSWSAVAGDNVSFTVGASANYSLSYQWLQNGTNLVGETAATLNLNGVQTAQSGYTYQCVVSDFYGSVSSALATNIVTATAVAPILTVQNITNYVGNNVTLTAQVGGTDAKGGYQWYLNGSLLSDGATANGSTLSGTGTSSLKVLQATTNDAGSYYLVVTNIAGSVSNTAANLVLTYAAPVFVNPPQPFTTFLGRNITNQVSAYGQLLTYKWYTSTKTTLSGTTLNPLSDVGDFSGTATASLSVSVNGANDATNYVIVVSNPGGSITSAPAVLTVAIAPAHNFVNYSNQVYTQDFNSLPIPCTSSAEGGNPLSILNAITNIAGINAANPTNVIVLANGNQNAAIVGTLTYSMDNPLDFGYPVFASGNIGGYGLSKMNGWYGWCQKSMIISATRGDQTQGAIVDNGMNYLADGTSIAGVTNRALGLVATSKTGVNAFALALVNKSTNTINTINLSYIGELWHNVPKQQVLSFGYSIDNTTNSTFSPGLSDGTTIDTLNGNPLYSVTNLNVIFPTNTDSISVWPLTSDQVSNIGVTNMVITNWPPNTTLWLVWQANNLGGAQNVAIDNVTFSTPTAPTIVSQPVSQTVAAGSAANFSVTASGSPTPSYQWLKNGANTGTGLTNLPFASTTTNDAANYSVVVANSAGSITSSVVSLTVLVPGTTISAVKSGSSLSLSWPANQIGWNLQVQTNPLSKGLSTNWVNVPNSTSTNTVVMPLNPANPAVFYRLKF